MCSKRSAEYYGTSQIDERGIELVLHVSRSFLASRYRRHCETGHGSASSDPKHFAFYELSCCYSSTGGRLLRLHTDTPKTLFPFVILRKT